MIKAEWKNNDALSAEQVTQTNNSNTLNALDYISRQAAIDALEGEIEVIGKANAEAVLKYTKMVCDRIKALPSAQPTLYGYSIEHLALIARVMQKENVTPEKAIECFEDLGRMVQMIMDEQKEIIKSEVEKWTV